MNAFLIFSEALLWGSPIWFWASIIITVVVSSIAMDLEDLFWSTAPILALGVILQLWSTVEILPYITVWNILIYLALGLVYAFIRTYLSGRSSVTELTDYDERELKQSIFRWWLCFPISLVGWLLTDVYKGMIEKASSLFYYVFKLGFKNSKYYKSDEEDK